MNTINILTGNIFTSKAQTIVNTVNCVGVMGAGIALECKLRYPAMFAKYVALCEKHQMSIGKLWLYRNTERWILNFPTKKHWKYPSKIEYIRLGLEKFLATYESKGITSIAFPVLGAQNGGISQEDSLSVMNEYLSNCSIPVEIYRYTPDVTDDLFVSFKILFQNANDAHLKLTTGLTADKIELIRDSLSDPSIVQINQIAKMKGIGEKTLEKAFAFMRNVNVEIPTQVDLIPK